jgi:hypothetical protein
LLAEWFKRDNCTLAPNLPADAAFPVEDAERFIEEVRGDDPELASYLRIEERELEGGRRETKASRRRD